MNAPPPTPASAAGAARPERRARRARRRAPTALARRELGWIGWGLAGSAGAGALVGAPLALPFAFALGYLAWLLLRVDALLGWLHGGAKARDAPPSAGLVDAVIERVHREKKYSRKQKNRYRSALTQFDRLASELPDATIVLDANRQIQWANPAAGAILGVHPERDRGQRLDNLVRAPEFVAFLADPEAEGPGDVELDSPHVPGRTLALRVVRSSKKLSVLIARDVTQRVRVREMRRAFVADVSHELRTPLTVIGGYLEMLEGDPRLPADVAEALARVDAQARRMRDIVEHLLELSKLEANPLGDDEGTSVAVGPMVRGQVEALAAADVAGQVFELEVDDALLVVGSERELYSACQNLLVNAVRYAGDGARVRVGWGADPDGRPRFSVADDGPGIEARHLARLSERFYRVDRGRSRESGGTGLGLAIVKHVAQRHGGSLRIDSVPGAGAAFTVELPAHRAERGEAAAVSAGPAGPAEPPGLPGPPGPDPAGSVTHLS